MIQQEQLAKGIIHYNITIEAQHRLYSPEDPREIHVSTRYQIVIGIDPKLPESKEIVKQVSKIINREPFQMMENIMSGDIETTVSWDIEILVNQEEGLIAKVLEILRKKE